MRICIKKGQSLSSVAQMVKDYLDVDISRDDISPQDIQDMSVYVENSFGDLMFLRGILAAKGEFEFLHNNDCGAVWTLFDLIFSCLIRSDIKGIEVAKEDSVLVIKWSEK